MHTLPFSQARAIAEIDARALFHNFRTLSRACGHCMAVVKGNAYGHGLSITVPVLLRAGCTSFAVASTAEALAVRRLAPFSDILLLGFAPLNEIQPLTDAKITLTAFSYPYAAALSRTAAKLRTVPRVHLKIDGGMCRLGFLPDDTALILRTLSLPHLNVCGIFTHFPEADTDTVGTKYALARFRDLQKSLPVSLFSHVSASAAALSIPEARPDAVRVGIALYGYPPVRTSLDLRRVMRVIAPVVQLHHVEKGTPVGYGGDFVCTRKSVIGTVPLGYADGFCRALSGHTLTVLCGKRAYSAPVIGRVCMDYLMLDLTDIPVKEGGTVCVFGDFSAAAQHAGTIPYELLSAISARVPRKRKGEI